MHELLTEFAFEPPDVAREVLRVDAERGRGGTHRRVLAQVHERGQAFHGREPVRTGNSSGGIAVVGKRALRCPCGPTARTGRL